MEENIEETLEEKRVWTDEEVEDIKSNLKEKYIRLYAEFENYKKRVQKEKDEIVNSTKAKMISSILDMDNDLSIAFNKIEDKSGIDLIISKLNKFLELQGIETIQTDIYDPDKHEVISTLIKNPIKVVDVVEKGYTLNGNIIRYPKVILG